MAKAAKPNFPTNLFNRANLPKLTTKEREGITVLVVDTDTGFRNVVRQLLVGLGFGGVSEASDNTSALEKITQGEVTHIIFETKNNKMPSKEFLTKVLEMDEDIIALPASFEPSVDDVFDLLVLGARGYIVKPTNEQSIEDAIIMATKAEPLSDAILHAKDRNEALVALIMSNIDRTATIMRQARHFETAKLELAKAKLILKRSIEVGMHFAKGGQDNLLEKIIEFSLARGEGPASRLGRARKRRKTKKKSDSPKDNEKTADSK